MGLTEDRNDPRLREIGPDGQQKAYLVLSEEERRKGYVRPLRYSYRHVGRRKDPDGEDTTRVGGCGNTTHMAHEIAETYARNPKFYGATYCGRCGTHLPVSEFWWTATEEEVGS